MERFFTEHHVMRDRDADELRRIEASDSEASEDDDADAQVHTHSVHDPSGPWKQTPTDGPWGDPQKKKAGTANRSFRSQHTGPKGVLNDYKAHKRQQREEYERKERERQAMLTRIATGVTVIENNECDCECDDMLLDDAFLQSYHAQRMQEIQASVAKRRQYGSLEYISPSQYLQLTDDIPAGVTTIVHLYHPESYPCTLLNEHLEQLAKELAHVKFAALVAQEADDSITMRDLPVVLVYYGSQLHDTIVQVSDQLDGEFTYDRIKQFVLRHAADAA